LEVEVAGIGKLSEITIGRVLLLKKEMSKQEYYFREPLEVLTRYFLKNFSSNDTLAMSDAELVKEYELLAEGRHSTFLDAEFHSYLAKEYMDLSREPRSALLDAYLQVSTDLKDIEAQLKFIESEEARVPKKNPPEGFSYGEVNYYHKQLAFYRNRNLTARTEIIDFVTNDIKAFALQMVSPSQKWQTALFKPSPYPYARRRTIYKTFPDIYDVRSLSPLLSKFGDQHISTIKKLEAIYETDRGEFYTAAGEYILRGFQKEELGVTAKIRSRLSTSHILHSRFSVIETILKHYENKDYLSFISMIPLQIEGIFHDICVEFDIDHSTLNGASISTKLELLQPKLKYLMFYEYYSFKFPVIRNQVAHGGIIEDDLEHTAMMLLLDFLPVCNMTEHENIPINESLVLLRKFEKNPDDYETIIDWLPYYKRTLPAFYKMEAVRDNLVSVYSTAVFWIYIATKLESEDSFDESKYLVFACKLKQFGLASAHSLAFEKKKKKIRLSIDARKASHLSWLQSITDDIKDTES
jgi:hypothetical protein